MQAFDSLAKDVSIFGDAEAWGASLTDPSLDIVQGCLCILQEYDWVSTVLRVVDSQILRSQFCSS